VQVREAKVDHEFEMRTAPKSRSTLAPGSYPCHRIDDQSATEAACPVAIAIGDVDCQFSYLNLF